MILNQLLNVIINLIVFHSCINICFAKESYMKDNPIDSKNEKLRICIVENRGSFRRTEKFCPTLEKQTNIECIIGVDRLDCARRISKGHAHFGVFSSEDLVGARWASLEILVTSEIRFHSEPFEYDVVVVVDNVANIHSAADLKKSRLCHPGKGLDNSWNDIISDYMENVMVPKQCEKDITLSESRIKATADFFGESCKPGPWVNDPYQDKILKAKYPSLCQLCFNPMHCGIGDKHWGRRGPLYCLTSGSGEVAYVRLDDVKSFFGFTGLTAESDPNNYSFLCPDSHLQPLTVKTPCTWISKPWSVVASRRSQAQKVQDLFREINSMNEWQQALMQLLESYHVNITSLDYPITIDDYLDRSSGYQSAHSFPACYPPRQIVYCTTTIIEFSKCSWLQEVSTVFGIEPNLQCIRGETIYRCLDDVAQGVADLVMVDQDMRLKSEKKFNLTSILYEFSTVFEQNYVTIAVVKKDSSINTFADLEGRIACFPTYDGAAFTAVTESLRKLNLTSSNCSTDTRNFFSRNSCFGDSKSTRCKNSDEGAFKCLNEIGDVAFMNLETFKNLTANSSRYNREDFKVLCPFKKSTQYIKGSDICYLTWTSKGVLLTNKNNSDMRINEIVNTLKTMDNHFGKKKYRSGNIPFQMFGPFDQKSNILFKDSTDSLKTQFEFENVNNFERNSEEFIESLVNSNQYCSSSYQEISHAKSFTFYFIIAVLSVCFGCMMYLAKEFFYRKIKKLRNDGFEVEELSSEDS